MKLRPLYNKLGIGFFFGFAEQNEKKWNKFIQFKRAIHVDIHADSRAHFFIVGSAHET